MVNLKTKAVLMGGVAFLFAVTTMAVLVMGNKERYETLKTEAGDQMNPEPNYPLRYLQNCINFSASPSTVLYGEKSTLSWNTCNEVRRCWMSNKEGFPEGSETEVTPNGSMMTNSLTSDISYFLLCTKVDGFPVDVPKEVKIKVTSSCTGADPVNATLCADDDKDLKVNTPKTAVSACGTPKCEYACNSGFVYQDSTKSCVAKIDKIDGSCGSANKAYPSSATSYGSDTFCSQGTPNPASPIFPKTDDSTSWLCQGSGGGQEVSCKASRSGELVNGSCGSADGRTFSSKPSSSLCSSGNASSVSDKKSKDKWTWTCEGINNGINKECSAKKEDKDDDKKDRKSTSAPSKLSTTVAPATGAASSVAFVLSLSAAITLGVWIAIKKIKG